MNEMNHGRLTTMSQPSWPPDGGLPGPASGLSERIRQRLGGLSPSERRVARALLSGPPTIGLESSVRLARHAGVSGPTVSRFISQLGFANYGAFQRALHEEIAARVMSPVEVYRQHRVEQGSADDLLSSSGAKLGEAVLRSLKDLDQEEFSRAVALLADASRQVLAVGGWFSHLLAGYLAEVLRQIRPRVRVVPPISSERAAAIADIGKKDVVVIFDFRRYERDTLELARAARAISARIVLLTDPWLSPVAEIADAVLPAQVAGPSPFESLTPTLAVVETLITAVAEALGDDGHRRLERLGSIAELWVRHWPAGAATVTGEDSAAT
jgi:DNA-binding MurR/RpiR family transcriptional regulator